MESLEEKVARLVREPIDVVPYDPTWPERFEQERARHSYGKIGRRAASDILPDGARTRARRST